MPLAPGQVLQNRYRIARLLEQGGFGAVYRAWDVRLKTNCAIKENLDTSEEAQRQFEREASLLASLRHPNLPRVSDHFFVAGQGQYLVMDLVDGEDLETILTKQTAALAEAQVLTWIAQVCDALSYLHSQQPPVIHRDIKPANIKITPAGQAILIDFGIAKVYDQHLRTTRGARAVSPGYSPHEQYGQVSGSRLSTDPRSDIYALGATLYTLLTGETPPESIQRVVGDPLIPAERINPGISKTTQATLEKALQIDPDKRFQNAEAFKRALLSPAEPNKPANAAAKNIPASAVAPPKSHRPVVRLWVAAVGMLALAAAILLIIANARRSTSTFSPPPNTPADVQSSPSAPFAPPTNQPTLGPTRSPQLHQVQSGETCSQIAADFNVTNQVIIEFNNLSDCETLFAGQHLLIPHPTPSNPSTPYPQATILPVYVYTRTMEIDGMEQVFVPPGVFRMGAESADPLAAPEQVPARAVYLEGYWIDRSEVTNSMYAKCVKDQACEPPERFDSATRISYYDQPAYGNYPVIYVSWADASAYCRWAGRRLPGEAQWEKAARGPDGRVYPWGSTTPTALIANFDKRIGDTTPIDAYENSASPYGALDMAGNVQEWVNDWFEANYYQIAPAFEPQGPESGEYRLLRGGSWLSPQRAIRAMARLWNLPDLRTESIGFRCAGP
jgi:serine/threonine-protein kinase